MNDWMQKKFRGRSPVEHYRYLLTVLALNIPLIFVILLLNLNNVDSNPLTWVYIVTTILGYYILPVLVVITALWLALFYFRKTLTFVAGAVITIFVYYLLVDHFTYEIAKIHIDLFWLEWILNDIQGFGLPPSTIRNVLLVLVGMIALEIGIFVFARRFRRPRFIILAFAVVTVASFTVSQVIHVVAYQKSYNPITNLTPHFPIYVPITSYSNASKYEKLLPISDSAADAGEATYSGSLYYPLKEINCLPQPDADPPNFVFILLESWRFDTMNETVTPNIFELSKRSSVFNDHFSSGNSTVAGVFGLFYGLHATYWTAVKANASIIDNPVFIDVLEQNDYAFGIYSRSNFERHKLKDAIFRGLEIHESFAGRNKVEQDRDMVDRLKAFFRQQSDSTNPFMTFTFFKSNHYPYDYPPEDSVFQPAGDINLMFADNDTDPTLFFNDYLNATHYVDALIGDIVDELDSLGQLDNTVIVITTDHAESFNDNQANFWGHGTSFTKFQTMVPLVLHIPNREPQQVDYRTSHIDIAPTLLQEVFGCSSDITDYSNGRNLFDKPTGTRPLVVGSYVNHAFIIGGNVFEIYPMRTRKYRLDDIRGEATDPRPSELRTIMTEIGRFYEPPEGINRVDR